MAYGLLFFRRMADVGKVYPSEIQLLRKELEVLGEMLSRERLDREAETEKLRLELEVLKNFLKETNSKFSEAWSRSWDEVVLSAKNGRSKAA